MGEVTNGGNGGQNLAEPNLALVPAHAGAVGGVIDPKFQHARQAADMALVQPDAGGADDPFHHQRSVSDLLAFDTHEAFLQIRPVVQLQPAQRSGDQILGAAGRRGAMMIKIGQSGRYDSLRHRRTAMTAHRLASTLDHHRIACARRDRQAAVETGVFRR